MPILKKCEICNSIFKTYNSRIKAGYGRFCSAACQSKWHSRETLGTKHPQYNSVIQECVICGKKVKRRPSEIKNNRKKCCSLKCMGKFRSLYLSKEKHSFWKGYSKVCQVCGKTFHLKPSEGIKRITCSRECMTKLYMEKLKGIANPNWKGGLSFEPYPLGWNKTFKEQIRQRDGRKCKICGIPEIECKRKLNVHHIDYNKNNLSPDNLISLCGSCHTKTNGNRAYFQHSLPYILARSLSDVEKFF